MQQTRVINSEKAV